jgi:hypothetical protein
VVCDATRAMCDRRLRACDRSGGMRGSAAHGEIGEIVRIQRIQNKKLWKRYAFYQNEKATEMGAQVNER